MNILVYFYDVEIQTNSTNSVGRLVADVVGQLEKTHQVAFFSMNKSYSDEHITTKPIPAEINFFQKLRQKLINAFYTTKKIKAYHLKKEAFRKALLANHEKYDYILVPALDEVEFLREKFPDACIIYWIHNISAICKKEYLNFVNKADIFLSPSRTSYHLLVEKLQPRPLSAEFIFMPNWIADVFLKKDSTALNNLRAKYHITNDEIVFIFSGSDLVLKGKFILEKAIERLGKFSDKKLVFFFAGSQSNVKLNTTSIRVISLGIIPPKELAAYYHISHFGCIPSLAYDHCPLALLEMIHCNVLPIASDIGGIKEITGAGYPYLITEPHEVNKWVDAIQNVILFPITERNAFMEKLNESVKAIYNKENSLGILEEIIKEEHHDK